MAIQNRRGAKKDFDATKMLPGELAVTTDGSRKVYVAFAPGDAKELASTEDVEETIQSGIEEIEQKKEEALAQFPNYEDKIKELETYKANSIISTSSGTVFHETDCAAVSPINIKLFGKSKQDGIPSMETPIVPVHHGESGSIGGKVCNSNLANPSKYEFGVGFGNALGVDVASINADGSVTLTGTPTITSGNLITLYLGDYLDELVDGETYITNGTFRIAHKDGTTDYLHLFTVNKSTTEYIKPYIQIRVEDYTNGMTIYPCFNVGTTLYAWQPYTEQPFTALTPNGLLGLPVYSGGNYVDSNGQQYLSNYKDYALGKNIEQVQGIRLTSQQAWWYEQGQTNGTHNFQLDLISAGYGKGSLAYHYVIATASTHFRYLGVDWDNVEKSKIYVWMHTMTVSFSADSEMDSLDKWKQFLDENEVYAYYILEEPITTDLTTEEIESCNALVMNYPNTTIVNDEGAYMEVEYVCDTQKHIEQNYVSKEAHQEHENRIAELEKAIVNS